MCYSLETSVIAAFGLAVVGVVTVYKAVRFDRRMLVFACFPLIFSVHQLVESVVWYSLGHPFAGDQTFRYIYTVIAFLLWPVLTPFAAAATENDAGRKRIWMRMCGCGIVVALYLSAKLAGADGINVSVVNHSLAYDPLFDRPPPIADLVYLALTVVPLASLDNRALNLFGVVVFMSFVYAIVEASAAWYSVWCLSAAAFSVIIFFAIREGESAALDEASM